MAKHCECVSWKRITGSVLDALKGSESCCASIVAKLIKDRLHAGVETSNQSQLSSLLMSKTGEFLEGVILSPF